MQSGYIILSLLLVGLLDVGQATFVVGTVAGTGVGLAVLLGAAAVGGVVGLGLGAAVLGGRRRGRRGGRSGRWGRRYRGRRDLAMAVEADDEDVWDMISSGDQAGCALKLICLLEAAEGKVDQSESVVLSVLGDLKYATRIQSASKLKYETAGWLGKLRGANSCEAAYGAKCRHTRESMMEVIRTIWGGVQPQAVA